MFVKPHETRAGLTIEIDGVPVAAEVGETVAAVLLRQAAPWARTTSLSGSKRAPYCMMGVCFDCLAEVDGIAPVQACLQLVREGMRVKRQIGMRRIG